MEADHIDRTASSRTGSSGAFERGRRRRLAARLSDRSLQLRALRAQGVAWSALSADLAFERDSRRLLDRVCAGLHTLFGCRQAVMGVTSSADPVLMEVRTVGLDTAEAERFEALRLSVGVTKQVMVDRRAHRFFNPAGDPLAVGLSGDYPPVHSGLIAPIASPARAYGWIVLIDARCDDGFSDQDEKCLSALGGQLGRIHENAILDRQVGRAAEQLEREVAHHRLATEALRDSELRCSELARRLAERG